MAKMTSIVPIKIKHNGQVHPISLDTASDAATFKQQIYEKTGVPPERMKVMIKGGMLKDDHDLTKIGAKPNITFSVIGTAGELPKAPTGPAITFLEDMTDSELALATKSRVGLTNLGNTCYLNSTLQVMRAIPELQTALNNFNGTLGGIDGESNLTAALRDLYKNLGQTTESFPPLAFLTILRQVAPQFAEISRETRQYAQQDAEEAWVRIVQALQNSLKGLPASSSSSSSSDAHTAKFVEQYMTGHMVIKRSTAEAPEEPASYSKDPFSILQCNISSSTNDMISGILDSLNQKMEKTSATLNRTAVYDEVSRIDRLPSYLTCHFVRFYWRRDINKKTKIMRKVKFPFNLDTTPFLTEELQEKIKKTNQTVKKIEKDRDERAKIRKRARAVKAAQEKAAKEAAAAAAAGRDVRMSDATTGTDAAAPSSSSSAVADTSNGKDDAAASQEQSNEANNKLGQALTEEEELEQRQKEVEEIEASIHPDLVSDVGCNPSGLYELVGVVTHKGAAADAGHYISWVRKDDHEDQLQLQQQQGSPSSESANDTKKAKLANLDKTEADEEWYKFDDDKVSIVNRDKITSLDGGGEDSVAYILLYRVKKL